MAGNKNQLVEARNKKLEVVDQAIKHSIMTLAQQGVDHEKFALIVREAVIANPDIVTANETSFARAIRKCCRDAIIPDGDRGALVVFGQEVVAMPMVSGMLQMAAEDLEAEIRSGVVHEGDQIKIIEGVGVEPQIITESEGTDIFLNRNKDNVIGAWCWIKLPFEDTPRITLFSKSEIDRARSVSRAKNGPWVNWPERMAEKSCVKSAIWRIRYLAHVRKNGGRLLRVIEDDNSAEFGEAQVDDSLYGDSTVTDAEVVEIIPAEKNEKKPAPEKEPEAPAAAEVGAPKTVEEPPPAEDPHDAGPSQESDDEGFLPIGDGEQTFDDDPTSL